VSSLTPSNSAAWRTLIVGMRAYYQPHIRSNAGIISVDAE